MESIKKSDFYFELPERLIAQDPLEDRSGSKMLMLDKETGKMEHRAGSRVPVLADFVREAALSPNSFTAVT